MCCSNAMEAFQVTHPLVLVKLCGFWCIWMTVPSCNVTRWSSSLLMISILVLGFVLSWLLSVLLLLLLLLVLLWFMLLPVVVRWWFCLMSPNWGRRYTSTSTTTVYHCDTQFSTVWRRQEKCNDTFLLSLQMRYIRNSSRVRVRSDIVKLLHIREVPYRGRNYYSLSHSKRQICNQTLQPSSLKILGHPIVFVLERHPWNTQCQI